ncbi:cupin domain-containing protein [Rhodobacteraceae bacterium 2CG4]|uniref:Cupin domain-containing protein n=1 Tax=Halovulum marinum TaxID=2662447 RepID=A0A6L5YVX5_9RHOB|nr:cupin domain-containing protein [Halovulum marinum]MSU88451.1 cupin domain-containing protein [Halovulum marinum]
MPFQTILRRIAACSALTVGAASVATVAQAGECPGGQTVTESNVQSDAGAKGVTDTVIGSIDLAEEAPMLDHASFRLRRLEIEPGGVVPWHSHGERPAIIYIVSGEIIEHRNTCAVPIVHKAGDVATEVHTTAHWWENTTDAPVVLLSADIFPEATDPNQM